MAAITDSVKEGLKFKARSRNYVIYLMVVMGLVAIMDQYLSTIKTTALPYIYQEFNLTPPQFLVLESGFLAFTFLIFLLNGLNDIIGRRLSILILILLMGLPSLGIVLFTPSITMFMIFYTIAIFATVSNMWTIPISEESPADKRGKYVAIVYIVGLLPLQAILPPLLITRLGLDWRWMYGSMFVMMIPVLIMWFFMKETSRYQLIQRERREGTRKTHLFGLGVIGRKDIRYIIISSTIWLAWLVYQFFYFQAGYYFMTIKGYSLSQWSTVLLFSLVLAMAGGLLSGWIMDRLGRKPALILGCIGLALILVLLGFGQGFLLPVAAALTGFFTSFTYTWIVVYVPEVFPTERRGACMGWTTTIARISYVIGPLITALCLQLFPTMEWFWVVGAVVILIPIAIILFLKPSETKVKELEEIEAAR